MDEAKILHMQEQIAQYYEAKLSAGAAINTAEDVASWATAKFGSSRIEYLWAVALDGQNRIYNWTQLSQGTVNQAAFYRRELARWALMQDAVGVILVHNHPSGTLRPSDADLTTMNQAKETLAALDINLLDSIIVVSGGQYYSFQQGGLL